MLKLNIGAGRQRLEGYIGVDFQKGVGVDVVVESAHKLPYKENEVDEIYTSHMIEHFDEKTLPLLLKEFGRVLKKGGKLVIICPDFEKAVRAWLEGDYNFRWGYGLKRIFGYQRNRGEYHYTGFTKKRFKRLLSNYGFEITQIKNQPSRFKRDARLIKDSDLYVEAIKK